MAGELWTDWCGGLPRRDDVAHRQTHRRPWWRDGRALLAAARAQAARPRRPRPRLHLPEHLSALVRADRRRAPPPGADHRPAARSPCGSTPGASTCARSSAPESLFIDIMMNVPIIFYAARETGDQALYDLAVAHCRTTERTLVRPDGGTAHEGIFDLETGEFLRQIDPPGAARRFGLERAAWPGRSTASARFTPTRTTPPTWPSPERNADHFLERLPDDPGPPLGLRRPAGPDRIDDSSAAAIAASGLWNLAELTRPIDPVGARSLPRRGSDDPRRAADRPVPRLERPRAGKAC